jgi:hypothetical protein
MIPSEKKRRVFLPRRLCEEIARPSMTSRSSKEMRLPMSGPSPDPVWCTLWPAVV